MASLHVVMRAGALALLLVAGATGTARGQATGIRATKHNLSASSTNTVRATAESELCVFCHTPHGGRTDAPLWNRNYSSANYTPYASPSLQSSPGQPNGYSKLCLSCHDGTIAIGDVRNTPNASPPGAIAMTGTAAGGGMPAGRTLIGTSLTNDHPVSMVFDGSLTSDDGELVNPATLTGPIKLYEGATAGVRNAVQCTTCHDPHTSLLPKFLRLSPRGRANNLCLSCHTKSGWPGSTHESSLLSATIDSVTLPVSNHACMSCHAPHTVDGAERLLRNGAVAGKSAIEQTCFQCHTTSGPAQNIQGEFAKANKHPVDNSAFAGNHKPMFIAVPPSGLPEGVLLQPGSPAPDPRFTDAQHVECVDCHNPHQVTKSNLLKGMRGIALNGSIVSAMENDSTAVAPSQQYGVCFRCHGDSFASALPATLASGLAPSNKRTEFQTANSAFHPVGGPGRNKSANLDAQLTPNGLSVNTVLRCTDCHNSNAYASTTGKVVRTAGTPSGPHGSANKSILRANYRTALGVTSYSSANFDLCYRCHSESALMGNSTNFKDDIDGKGNLHWLHILDRADKTGAVCKSCHYSIHSNVAAANTQYNVDGAISFTPPSSTPTRMVNFHPNVRPINGRARPEWWINTATRERRCYLACHTETGAPGGAWMDGLRYRPASGDLP